VSEPLWTDERWRTWCSEQRETTSGCVQKASVPLHEARVQQAAAVRALVAKRQANPIKRPAACGWKRPAASVINPKRTPFTLKRRGSLIVGGVKKRLG
jgi:hypothetical protein